MKPVILVTNDDGFQSPGIAALEQALSAVGEVTVVAPDREMSATSHCLTLNQPLRYQIVGPRRYAAQGTPADCVILAGLRILEERPALVVSGVNRGANVGDDINYSGTVAGAFEGALQGIPGIAVSAVAGAAPDFRGAARIAAILARRIFEYGLPRDMILNVNFPEVWNGEVRLTRQGRRPGKAVLVENVEGHGQKSFWLHEELHASADASQDDSLTDFAAIAAGYVSISPLRLDRTAHAYLNRFSQWVDGLRWSE